MRINYPLPQFFIYLGIFSVLAPQFCLFITISTHPKLLGSTGIRVHTEMGKPGIIRSSSFPRKE
jgi:hypothetical protein